MKSVTDEKAARGQTVRTETMPTREKMVSGPGEKANYTVVSRGGASDVSHSLMGNKVKRR